MYLVTCGVYKPSFFYLIFFLNVNYSFDHCVQPCHCNLFFSEQCGTTWYGIQSHILLLYLLLTDCIYGPMLNSYSVTKVTGTYEWNEKQSEIHCFGTEIVFRTGSDVRNL